MGVKERTIEAKGSGGRVKKAEFMTLLAKAIVPQLIRDNLF